MEESIETVQVEFTMGLREGTIGIQSVVPAGKTNLTQILPVLQSIEELLVDATGEALGREGRTISCRAGCGACCRQMVPISIFEAEALSEWIRTLPPEGQEELRRRFHSVLQSLSQAGMIDRLVTGDWFGEDELARKIAIDYFHLGLACPFLEEESCSIHPIRPLSCREYLVTSPAEYCADPATRPVEGVPMPLKLSLALYRMGAEIERGSRGWIPLVFLLAWMEGGFTPGAAFSGTGPEVLYQFLQRVATQPAAEEQTKL